MLLFRPGAREPRTYSLDEAAEFLEFDRKAVVYWLRMGHLSGRQDKRTGEWRIQPQALIEFLREAQEPMPTCIRAREEVVPTTERSAISA
ncbi:MAG: helix-turn-helix domain-containing protein [Thermomicrobiales bacterium]